MAFACGVKFVPHLDRSDLVHYTTHTVLRNLTDGVLLVTLILFLFLGNVRSALIVTITIPFSLLLSPRSCWISVTFPRTCCR
jgi:heavy metal efflux system protein